MTIITIVIAIALSILSAGFYLAGGAFNEQVKQTTNIRDAKKLQTNATGALLFGLVIQMAAIFLFVIL